LIRRDSSGKQELLRAKIDLNQLGFAPSSPFVFSFLEGLWARFGTCHCGARCCVPFFGVRGQHAGK